jgi:hypothetical protein
LYECMSTKFRKMNKDKGIIEKLKPCPFCGGKAIIKNKHFKDTASRMKFMGNFQWHGEGDNKWTTIYFAGCENNNCDMHPITRYQVNKEDAIKIWNTRSELATLEQEQEEQSKGIGRIMSNPKECGYRSRNPYLIDDTFSCLNPKDKNTVCNDTDKFPVNCPLQAYRTEGLREELIKYDKFRLSPEMDNIPNDQVINEYLKTR